MAVKKKKKTGSQKRKGIESKFIDLTDLDEPMSISIYGRPGSGKTTFAGTMPKPILLLDVKDKGGESAKHKGLKPGEITILSIDSFNEIYDAYDYIIDHIEQFKSVVIDHCTALQDMCQKKLMEDEGKDRMSINLYGTSAGMMKEVITLYLNLSDEGIYPLLLSQDRVEGGEGDGEDQLMPEVGPALQPSVASVLNAGSRIIGHTYLQEKVTKKAGKKVREIEYRLRLGPNPYYITKVTKSRDIDVPMYISDASFDKVMDVVNGKFKIETTPKKKKKTTKKK